MHGILKHLSSVDSKGLLPRQKKGNQNQLWQRFCCLLSINSQKEKNLCYRRLKEKYLFFFFLFETEFRCLPLLYSHLSPFPVTQRSVILLLNQKSLGEAGPSMLYTTKLHTDINRNLTCSRSGGSSCVWEELFFFFRGSVNWKGNIGSVAVSVMDR